VLKDHGIRCKMKIKFKKIPLHLILQDELLLTVCIKAPASFRGRKSPYLCFHRGFLIKSVKSHRHFSYPGM